MIGVNETQNNILFCEVKWKVLSREDVMDILRELKEKSSKIRRDNTKRDERFLIIAKKIELKNEALMGDAIFLELDDILPTDKIT